MQRHSRDLFEDLAERDDERVVGPLIRHLQPAPREPRQQVSLRRLRVEDLVRDELAGEWPRVSAYYGLGRVEVCSQVLGHHQGGVVQVTGNSPWHECVAADAARELRQREPRLGSDEGG